MTALAAAKLLGGASRRLGRGGGTAAPGLIVERFAPALVAQSARRLGHGLILVTGTNGKTTTSQLVASIAAAAGWRVIANRTGSNLMRGIAAAAVEATDVFGQIKCAQTTLGVFEVDEATVPEAAARLRPRAIVFTNLFRDQLDRYGEVDSILGLWRRTVERLDPPTQLILNADDPSVASLGHLHHGPAIYYGIEDRSLATAAEHAADARWCMNCGGEYQYQALYYGHIGVWNCPTCGAHRPEPQVRAERVVMQPDMLRLCVEAPGGRLALESPLGGLYNACNILAASAGAVALGLPSTAIDAGVREFRAAFGRQERVQVRGRDVRILLCKNPAGANQVLRLLAAEPKPLNLLLLLNDGIADGRDVSWIWDVDYELLAGRAQRIVVSGGRALDLTLRLKYASLGVEAELESDSHAAIERALAATPERETLNVLPTYTAMLDVREQLAKLGGKAHYWET